MHAHFLFIRFWQCSGNIWIGKQRLFRGSRLKRDTGFTCVGAKVAFECRVAREGAIALAADVAADPGVDLHVLLQGGLRLEALPTQQTEDGHV